MLNSPRSRALAAVSAAVALTATGLAASAGAAPTYDYVNKASYILDVRSAGVEAETWLPATLYQDVGYSGVFLAHDIGEPQGRCDSNGAAYFLGQYVEEAVLGKGAAPPDAGDVSGGYHNPVHARDTKPNNSAGENTTNSHPGVVNPVPPGQVVAPVPSDGTPLTIQAKCDNDVKGTGTGTVGDVQGVASLVGSTSSAQVDKTTGEYISSGNAYATGIAGAGALDAVSSFMQVNQKPGKEPTVTYRMSIFNSKDANSGLGNDGFTFSGTNVPVDQLVTQFNSQAKTFSDAAAAIGPFGFQILAPQVGVQESNDSGTTGLKYIIAPAIAGGGGSHLRDGTIGSHEQFRFGSVSFTGTYDS
jgi:hypothetical protein